MFNKQWISNLIKIKLVFYVCLGVAVYLLTSCQRFECFPYENCSATKGTSNGGPTPANVSAVVLAGNIGRTGSLDSDIAKYASFNLPQKIAFDSSGTLYIADTHNHCIRKITPSGVVTTLAGSSIGYADGTGTAASFNLPYGIAVDSAGTVYVADSSNHRIRKITPSGVVTTLAGSGTGAFADGTGTAASFLYPYDLALDSSGTVYVADSYNHRIRKITASGVVTTLAGSGSPAFADGTGTAASFKYPYGITVDSSGNLYVADSLNHRIRKITPSGVVTTFAGTGGAGQADDPTGTNASFQYPFGLTVDSAGIIYVADTYNHLIRKIMPSSAVTTLAGSAGTGSYGDGTGTAALFNYPNGVAVDSSGTVYVADYSNSVIRKIIPSSGVVTTFAGSVSTSGNLDATGEAAAFNEPNGMTLDSSGNLYVADSLNHRIRKITPSGVVTTLAGSSGSYADGVGTAAGFTNPQGITVDSSGNFYVADTSNQVIRKILPSDVVSTLAGSAGTPGSTDGPGAAARFDSPIGIVSDSSGTVYVVENLNNLIRKITPPNVVTTFAGSGTAAFADGTGTAASFNLPKGIAVDSAGTVYVADTANHVIRKITLSGVVTTLAGTAGVTGSADGTGTAASFNSPKGIAVDSAGTVYVADTGNKIIRTITSTGVVNTLAKKWYYSDPNYLIIDQTQKYLYVTMKNGIVKVSGLVK